MGLVKASWFLHDLTRGIFSKLKSLWEQLGELDTNIATPHLTPDEILAVITDPYRLPEDQNLYAYCKILSQAHRNRKILSIAKRLADNPDPALIAEIWTAFDEAEIFQDRVKKLDMVLVEAIESLNSLKRDQILACGFATMDKAIRGMRPGELYTIGARPGHGKSTFAAAIAVDMAKRGIPVLFFGTEMSAHDLALNRIIPAETGFKTLALRDGISAVEIQDVMHKSSGLIEAPLWICDSPSPSLDDILFVTQKIRPKIVFVDYLQRTTPPAGEIARLQWGAMVRGLGVMARTESVPVVLLSALSRESERTQEPKMSNLSESSEIERESHVVILLWIDQNDQPDPSKRKIKAHFAKNRNGPHVDFDLYIDKNTAKICEGRGQEAVQV